jgi:hypothetical protein
MIMLTVAWGKEAFVVLYRLAGNLYSWVVTDHQEHWMPLFTSWVGGHQVFEPVSGRWQDIGPRLAPGWKLWPVMMFPTQGHGLHGSEGAAL